MSYICTHVIGIGPSTRARLIELGITQTSDLQDIRARCSKRELDHLRYEIRIKLVALAQWLEENPNRQVINELDEDVFYLYFEREKQNLEEEDLGRRASKIWKWN